MERRQGIVSLGISIDNSNAVIAGSLSNKEVVICENKSGEISTPNCISFFQGECLIGRAALQYKETNPETTYYNILRLIGKRPYDQNIIEEIKDLSYPVDLNYKNPSTDKTDDRVRLPFNIPGYNIKEPLYPEHFVALLMKYLYDCAQKRSSRDQDIKDAVLTCPHSFNENQRRAMRDSGRIAGFKILEVIDEPIAATISYLNSNQESKKEERLMVFDFGGTSLSVSIVEVRDLKIRVIAEYRDDNLGGKNIDMDIFEYASKELLRKYNFNIDRDSKYKVLEQCENAKDVLSRDIPFYSIFFDNYSIHYTIGMLEKTVLGYKERMNSAMEMALKRSKQPRESISNILMVGGSSRIQFVKNIVSEYMGREVYSGLDPIQAIPEGAAIYGAILKGIDFNLSGLTVHSRYIGIEMFSDGFHEIRSLFRSEDYTKAEMPITVGPIKIKGNRGSKSIQLSVFSSEEDICANINKGESPIGREIDNEEEDNKDEKNEGRNKDKDNQKEEIYDEDEGEKLKILMSKSFTNPMIGKDLKPYVKVKLNIKKEAIVLTAYSGPDRVEEIFLQNKNGFKAGQIRIMRAEVDLLISGKKISKESTPMNKVLDYLLSNEGVKELVGDKDISTWCLGKFIQKNVKYLRKHSNMTQAESIMYLMNLHKEMSEMENVEGTDYDKSWKPGRRLDIDDVEEDEEEDSCAVESVTDLFEMYIKSYEGISKLFNGMNIQLSQINKIIDKYKDWASKNRKATKLEVDKKFAELKEEIQTIKQS